MSIFVSLSLSLPSTFLLYYNALFFVVFLPLDSRIKFSFLLCFIASFCHLPSFVFLLPRLLFLPRFVRSVLFMSFFLPLFLPYCLSSISNFTFPPHFYIVLLLPFSASFSRLLFFSFSFHIFLSIFPPWWFAIHPNLHLTEATTWHVHTCYADLLSWIDYGKIDGVIFQTNKSRSQ
jgi:hypothetical protein